jgi:hypothetical protein
MDDQLNTSFLLDLGRYMAERFEKYGDSEEAYRLKDGTEMSSEMSSEMKLTAIKAVEAWALYQMRNELKDVED